MFKNSIITHRDILLISHSFDVVKRIISYANHRVMQCVSVHAVCIRGFCSIINAISLIIITTCIPSLLTYCANLLRSY